MAEEEDRSMFDPFWEFVLNDYDDRQPKSSGSRRASSSSSSSSHWYDGWSDSSAGSHKRRVKFRDKVQVEWRAITKEGREPISREPRQYSWTELSKKPYPLKRSSSDTLSRPMSFRRRDSAGDYDYNDASFYYASGTKKNQHHDKKKIIPRIDWFDRRDDQSDKHHADHKPFGGKKLLQKLICKKVSSKEREEEEFFSSFTF